MAVASFLLCGHAPAHASTEIAQLLCDLGIRFVNEGRYDEAIHEFQKALLVRPDYAPAVKYLKMLKTKSGLPETEPTTMAQPGHTVAYTEAEYPKRTLEDIGRQEIIERTLSEFENIQRDAVVGITLDKIEAAPGLPKEKEAELLLPPEIKNLPAPSPPVHPITRVLSAQPKVIPARTIDLSREFTDLSQPVVIEREKSVIIIGRNVQRFLVTQPDIVSAQKEGPDKVVVTGKNVGYSYLYVWDDGGRRNLEFLCTPPKPEGFTLAEEMRKEEEAAGSFKLRYNLDYNSYNQGRRLDSLERKYYSWYHNLFLTGATPYGDVDSSVAVRTLSQTSDITYFTFGLSKGVWGRFKGFSLRGFDFYPDFSNLTFAGSSGLRGGMLTSPAFGDKLSYTAFWGKDGGGRYGNLSPGLAKARDSFLEGINAAYYVNENLDYGVSVLHGYGRDRPQYLNPYGYNARANWRLDNWHMGYEAAFDGERLAHLFSGDYRQRGVNATYELRNISKQFYSIAGEAWRRGELGGLFTLDLAPSEKWDIYNRLDAYQDRFLPALDNQDRWNEDYDLNARYTIDPSASLRFGYTLQNDLGKLSQRRYQSPSLALYKTFHLIRNVSSFIDLRHQENVDYTNPSSDYTDEKVSAGLRFNLVDSLYYFLNEQFNFLHENFTGNHSYPQALETGLEWNSQLGKGPFFGNARFTYRNEEDAASTFSFLSGQDYIEGFAELSYRPQPSTQAYCSTRIRNVWADNENVTKRVEAEFNLGLRFLWDIGFHWNPVGAIEGYVFKDLNFNGIREKGEEPIEGVKLWLGKKQYQVTDTYGHYKFRKVQAKNATVAIDTSTLPAGFVLTSPAVCTAEITQKQSAEVDFGVIARTEISGFVFEDVDGDGKYTGADKGIRGVVLKLDNGRSATTDASGRYAIINASPGEYTVSLDLSTLSVSYLPTVPITKKITLFEGVTYEHNIPLKKAQN